MKAKRLVAWIVGGLVGAGVVLVVIVAATTGSEASRLKTSMDEVVSKHATLDDVKRRLTDMGYDLGGAAAELDATGPHHSAIVYNTWLTVKVTFNEEAKAHGYHIDRASSWF